jgi:hypothetical protein
LEEAGQAEKDETSGKKFSPEDIKYEILKKTLSTKTKPFLCRTLKFV